MYLIDRSMIVKSIRYKLQSISFDRLLYQDVGVKEQLILSFNLCEYVFIWRIYIRFCVHIAYLYERAIKFLEFHKIIKILFFTYYF